MYEKNKKFFLKNSYQKLIFIKYPSDHIILIKQLIISKVFSYINVSHRKESHLYGTTSVFNVSENN